MSEEDLAYAAGFLDGEGCFFSSPRGKITVSCSNTYRPVVEWLHDKFGGSIHRQKPRKGKANHRMVHTWQVASGDAARVCSKVAPFLKQKAPQALLLMAIQQTMRFGGRKLSQDVKDERRRLSEMLKGMKHVAWA